MSNITKLTGKLDTSSGIEIGGNRSLMRDCICVHNGNHCIDIRSDATSNQVYTLPNKDSPQTFAMLSDLGTPSISPSDSSSAQVIYVAATGNILTGTGTQLAPFRSVRMAMETIIDSGPDKQYSISISSGDYDTTDDTIYFKPYVYLVASDPFTVKIKASLSLHQSCLIQDVRIGAYGCIFDGLSIIFDFSSDPGHMHIVEFKDCQFGGRSFIFKAGNPADSLLIQSGTMSGILTVSGGLTEFRGTIFRNKQSINTNGGVNTDIKYISCFINGDVEISSSGTNSTDTQFISSPVVSPFRLILSNEIPGNTTYQYDSSSLLPISRLINTDSAIGSDSSGPIMIGGTFQMIAVASSYPSIPFLVYEYSGFPVVKIDIICSPGAGSTIFFQVRDLTNSTLISTGETINSIQYQIFSLTSITNLPDNKAVFGLFAYSTINPSILFSLKMN